MSAAYLPSIDCLAAALRRGEMAVADVSGEATRRVAEFNATYRAFSHLADDVDAAAAALQGEIDRGRSRGPLHGLAVSIKGNLPVAGLPWTEGSAVHAGRIAVRDAAVVARVREAGGIVLGTTTLSELAMYGVVNAFEPMGLNPWDVTRTAGGSSTGAAVAAALAMAHVNVGTDAGGSIRNPACHCGVVGFMPRIGALPLEGKANYAPSVATVGLIGRSVADVEIAYRALARDVAAAPTPMRRVLVLRKLVEAMCDDETLSLFAAALDRMRAAGFTVCDGEVAGWLEGERAAGTISLFEGGRALQRMDADRLSEALRTRAAAAAALDPQQVAGARSAAAALRRNVSEKLRASGADAIVTPTWPFAAPPIDAQTVLVRGRTVSVDPHRNCFVRAANAIDACAITVPMGVYPTAAVPAGLHLTCEGGDEARLLGVAQLVERALPPLPVAPPLRSRT